MPRHSSKTREEARKLYLTGDVSSVAEIARRLMVKAHTVGTWKKQEDWDGLKIRIEKSAAEQLVEKLASERVTLNTSHFRLWGLVVSHLFETMQQQKGMDIRSLEKIAGILERAQRGQRLARGLSLDGQTEEQIRAQAEADGRALVDLFIDIVKQEVPDEQSRDRIARALMEACEEPEEAEGVA